MFNFYLFTIIIGLACLAVVLADDHHDTIEGCKKYSRDKLKQETQLKRKRLDTLIKGQTHYWYQLVMVNAKKDPRADFECLADVETRFHQVKGKTNQKVSDCIDAQYEDLVTKVAESCHQSYKGYFPDNSAMARVDKLTNDCISEGRSKLLNDLDELLQEEKKCMKA